MRIDHKYKGKVTKNDGTPVPEEELIVFRARDLAVVPMLSHYIEVCKALKVSELHITGIKALKERVEEYQRTVSAKVPDTTINDIAL